MKKLFLAASGLALAATGAFAASDSGLITVNAVIAEYIDVNVTDASITYDPVNPITGLNSVGANINGAAFEVTSNTTYDLELTFNTWNPTAAEDLQGVGSQTWDQVAFSNGSDTIGGSLWVDTSPAGNPNDNGAAGVVYSGPDADFRGNLLNQPAGTNPYELGAQIEPRYSSTGSIPAPGTYSVEVMITASTN